MSNIRVSEAQFVLKALGFPTKQQNERSALALLALLDLSPDRTWADAQSPLMGITPIMDFARTHYQRDYKPNTRESFRKETVDHFRQAAIVVKNPDNPGRPTNSGATVYQIEASALELLRRYGSPDWETSLADFLATNMTLSDQYARVRQMQQIPVRTAQGKELKLSPGDHNILIKAIIEEFGSRYAPDGLLVYVGDTEDKWAYFDRDLLASLNIHADDHGKMPDVAIYLPDRNWLLLIESVVSHGPVDGKRYAELKTLFQNCSAGLVYVTAFPSRARMRPYLSELAWETEVWTADAPTHLIHFNGDRFLGPYTDQ